MRLRFLLGLLLLCAPALFGQQLELTCPTGTSNINQVSPVFDNNTQDYRQWLCVDFSGNVFIQGTNLNTGSGVTSINTVPGAFTFTGTGVSCVTTTCTFTGGTGSGTVGAGTPPQLAVYNGANSVAGSTFLSQASNGLTITGSGGDLATFTGPINSSAPLTFSRGFSASGTFSSTVAPGSCSTPALNGGGSTGVNFGTATTYIGFCTSTGGTELARFTSASGTQGLLFPSGGNMNWTNAGINTSVDTNVTRAAAGWFQVGSGTTSNNLGGVISSANACEVTAGDITSTTPAAQVNVCTITIPALAAARTWVLHCNISWAITAGTGTNTFQVGIASATLPNTPATFFNSVIYSTSGSGPNYGASLFSTSGGSAAIIATGPTYTPSGVTNIATLDGSLNLPTGAGSLTAAVFFNGTTVTGVIRNGSYCTVQ